MQYTDLKRKYIGLDVFRIVCAGGVCAFHTIIHLGANYGILQPALQMGAVFMTAFFLVSGFSLFVNYAGTDIIRIGNWARFLKNESLA